MTTLNANIQTLTVHRDILRRWICDLAIAMDDDQPSPTEQLELDYLVRRHLTIDDQIAALNAKRPIVRLQKIINYFADC